ncbi:MAG: hypothetical protein KIT84_30930 [Labilithrix sp.]|nr:hypothetical protein [Labilithrix sp.]MCW5815483.1 hypothetical protein [Labilithrix sp.]
MFRRFVSAVVVAAALAVPSMALAGNTAGPSIRTTTVGAHQTDVYAVTLRGGEAVSVLVKGDGDTDLDCFLRDENGNVVARDVDSTDTCLLTMTPRWTGAFRIEVRNNGGVYNRYTIRTN